MIFVTADSNRQRLENLTKLLVSAFPGCTVYQHTNPLRAPRDVFHNKVSAVFLEAEMDKMGGVELMQMLLRQKPDVPVFILSEKDGMRGQTIEAGACDCLAHPLDARMLKEAILSASGRGSDG